MCGVAISGMVLGRVPPARCALGVLRPQTALRLSGVLRARAAGTHEKHTAKATLSRTDWYAEMGYCVRETALAGPEW